MLRWSVAVVVLIVLMLLPAAAIGQEASPTASPAAGPPLDLAAMALVPPDVDLPGIGIASGLTTTFDQEVVARAELLDMAAESARDMLVEIGWQRSYVNRLRAPVTAGEEEPVLGELFFSTIVEYADTRAAAAAFQNFAPPRWRRDPRVIGDESAIAGPFQKTADSMANTGLTFRIDNLIAQVWVYGRESAPPPALVGRLGLRYLERIEQVRRVGGPGLSTRLVRPERREIVPPADNYYRLGGVSFPAYDGEVLARLFTDTPYREASDAYVFSQFLPIGREGPADDPGYTTILLRFPTAGAAAAWFAAGPEHVAEFGPDWTVEHAPAAARFGDESLTFAIEGQDRSGYLIYVRVGREIAQVQLLALPGTPVLAGLQELAAAQVECLRLQEICEAVPVPPALVDQASPGTRASRRPLP